MSSSDVVEAEIVEPDGPKGGTGVALPPKPLGQPQLELGFRAR
jgi:hypothetical protein